jgi:hypothetical protein
MMTALKMLFSGWGLVGIIVAGLLLLVLVLRALKSGSPPDRDKITSV